MELKWRNRTFANRTKIVLIVPLWNWNLEEDRLPLIVGCFNCTFMELKYCDNVAIDATEVCFNCTFMELKFNHEEYEV